MLVSLCKNQVDYIGKSSSQTNSLRPQKGNISWSLFNKKSPLDRNKSHLYTCMIPNWYFDSPVALVSWYDQVFLLPWTRLTPCTFLLTTQTCLSCWTTKEPFPFRVQPMTWHRTDHLPLQRNKVPSWNYPRICCTWLTKHTCETKEEWELSPVPTLSYVPVDSSASFDYCICNKSFLFYYAALLTVYSFVTNGFIYSALKDSETTGHIDQSTRL